MNRPSWLQKIYWTRFAKPAEERVLFRELLKRPVGSILEIGVGDCQRMRRIAKLARLSNDVEKVRYIGTDEFESAQDGGRHLSLKQAHQIVGQLGFKASLIPGDATSAIPRVAHKFGASDVVVINGGLDVNQPLAGFVGGWLNRLAHDGSVVLACHQAGSPLSIVPAHLLQTSLPEAA